MKSKRMAGLAAALAVALRLAGANCASAAGATGVPPVAGSGDLQANPVPALGQNAKDRKSFDPAKTGPRVLFVGNSITLHGPRPQIGWTNNWGMAASALERDYVHVLQRKIAAVRPDAQCCLLQVAGSFERSFFKPDWSCERNFRWAREFKPDVIVLFFGANVPKDYDAGAMIPAPARTFGEALDAFRTYLDPEGKALVLFSQGFYVRPKLDAEKEAVARRRGDVFVNMEDVRSRKDAHGRYNHPGDLGMELIAERFWQHIEGRIRTFRRIQPLDWDSAAEIARGMKYMHIAMDEPRRMENFLVRVDLHTPGLRVASSGRAPNWGAVMDDYTNGVMLVDVRRQRTRNFLEERRAHGTNMVLAVNTSPWGPWRPPYTHKHGRFAHLTVSAGEVVSHNVTRGEMLVIFTNNVAVVTNALDDALLPSVAAAHPGHGANIILRGGVPVARPRPRRRRAVPDLAPRTAIGISADGRWLYALVVDGRQPGYSMGADMDDLVRLLLAAGASDAINMDGGGSSTLAWWDAEKGKTVIPNKHGLGFAGYRPVAMNLGFYFE